MKMYHVHDTVSEKKTAVYSTPKGAKEDAQCQKFYTGADVVETEIKGSTDMFTTIFNLLNDKSIHSIKGTETIIGKFSNPMNTLIFTDLKKAAENEEQRSEKALYPTYQGRLLGSLMTGHSETPIIDSFKSQYGPQDPHNGQQHSRQRYKHQTQNIRPQTTHQVMCGCHGPNNHNQNHSSRHGRTPKPTRVSHRKRNSRKRRRTLEASL